MPTERFPIDDDLAVWEYTCPRAFVPLSVGTHTNTRFTIPFLFDSGAAVTLFPIQLAERYHIPFEVSEPTAEKDCPRTPLGRLPGFRGQLDVRLMGIPLTLPCHFYEFAPPGQTAPAAAGGGTGRVRQYTPGNLEEYEQLIEGQGPLPPPPSPPPLSLPRSSVVLGRLGFTSRFSVLFDARDQGRFVEVSNEPPNTRRR